MTIYWSGILATGCYAGLAMWRFAIARTHPGAQHLAFAFTGMALWIAALLFASPPVFAIAELLQNAGWLAYLYLSTRSNGEDSGIRRAITLFSLGLGGLAVALTGLSFAIEVTPPDQSVIRLLLLFSIALRWLFAAIGLLFAHFLYRSTPTATNSGFRLILVTLEVMWAYNLNVYTMMVLGYPQALTLSMLHGAVSLLLAPAFMIGARRKEQWKVSLSRKAATQSLLFVVIGAYFVVVSSATRAAIWAGESAGGAFKILLAGALTIIVVVLAAMPRVRAYIKTIFIKHLFEHRYDYRREWLRFSATIGDRGTSLLAAEERAIRSLADVTESQGGILLIAEPVNRLVLAGAWQLDAAGLVLVRKPVDPTWLAGLVETARIVNFDHIRTMGGPSDADGAVPHWLIEDVNFWIAVPLVRSRRLVGLIVLSHPAIERALDWEDFDLLKAIAQQVAVHLTDAESHSKLEEARRYDEFNRRFAFIIHDIKNVVSQLSLVSSNAVEHGANPKFQASMVKTLGNATGKMAALLSRLSPDRITAEPDLKIVNAGRVVRRLVSERRAATPIAVTEACNCTIWADEEQLLEALGHLLSNAVEASAADAVVSVSATVVDGTAFIAIEDRGCGMSPNFIRNELYKPFTSTKSGGFGIGAAEARAIVMAMGGELQVDSAEGKGTVFSACFPLYRLPFEEGPILS